MVHRAVAMVGVVVRASGDVDVVVGLGLFGVVVYEDVLDDSILRDLSSRHVGAVLQLAKERELGGLVSHHGRHCRHLAWLILLEEVFDLLLSHWLLGVHGLLLTFCWRRGRHLRKGSVRVALDVDLYHGPVYLARLNEVASLRVSSVVVLGLLLRSWGLLCCLS